MKTNAKKKQKKTRKMQTEMQTGMQKNCKQMQTHAKKHEFFFLNFQDFRPGFLLKPFFLGHFLGAIFWA